MNMTLTKKLVIGGILAAAVPLLIVGAIAIQSSSNALIQSAKQRFEVLTAANAETIHEMLQGELKIVKDLSVGNATIRVGTAVEEKGLAGLDKEVTDLNLKFETAQKTFGQNYEAILATDIRGAVYADSQGGKFAGKSIANTPYFLESKEGRLSVGAPEKSMDSGQMVVWLCGPIHSRNGKFVGSVVVILKARSLADKIASQKIGNTGYGFMVDANGTIIAHPVEKHVLNLNLNLKTLKGMEKITQRMLSREAGVETYVFQGIEKLAGFAPVKQTGWGVAFTQNMDEFLAPSRTLRNILAAVMLISMVIVVALFAVFARKISRPVSRATDELHGASGQIAQAAQEVSGASQSLAEGTQEQAAAIEETSSSLEEMSSMTKTNAENANQANAIVTSTKKDMEGANQAMTDLVSSMNQISKASEETQKIVKTIDEIAFQTNLLALNAAVEAARAGEAGAGFAVVAEEVRNLAMRAADAAKNTANLIDGTVKQIKDGTELVGRTHESFVKVAEGSTKIGQLVDEIAAASNEQAQGIEQLNRAVSEMDKVTQQNAANAEESASASEELNAQAIQLTDIVDNLLAVIEGQKKSHGAAQAGLKNVAGKKPRHTGLAKASHRPMIVKPDQRIPMKDEDNEF